MHPPMNSRWYVCRTQRNKERLAVTNLTNQGYRCWLPSITETVRRGGRFATVAKPMFPAYIFVQLDLECQRWRPIDGTIGVVHIITSGGRPVALPAEFVEQLSERERVENTILSDTDVRSGDSLRIFDGAFTEFIGRVSDIPGQDRVTLLMNLMSRSVPVTVPLGKVAPAAG